MCTNSVFKLEPLIKRQIMSSLNAVLNEDCLANLLSFTDVQYTKLVCLFWHQTFMKTRNSLYLYYKRRCETQNKILSDPFESIFDKVDHVEAHNPYLLKELWRKLFLSVECRVPFDEDANSIWVCNDNLGFLRVLQKCKHGDVLLIQPGIYDFRTEMEVLTNCRVMGHPSGKTVFRFLKEYPLVHVPSCTYFKNITFELHRLFTVWSAVIFDSCSIVVKNPYSFISVNHNCSFYKCTFQGVWFPVMIFLHANVRIQFVDCKFFDLKYGCLHLTADEESAEVICIGNTFVNCSSHFCQIHIKKQRFKDLPYMLLLKNQSVFNDISCDSDCVEVKSVI